MIRSASGHFIQAAEPLAGIAPVLKTIARIMHKYKIFIFIGLLLTVGQNG
jgi:hypothetical protein